jgi:hypothetical protein
MSLCGNNSSLDSLTSTTGSIKDGLENKKAGLAALQSKISQVQSQVATVQAKVAEVYSFQGELAALKSNPNPQSIALFLNKWGPKVPLAQEYVKRVTSTANSVAKVDAFYSELKALKGAGPRSYSSFIRKWQSTIPGLNMSTTIKMLDESANIQNLSTEIPTLIKSSKTNLSSNNLNTKLQGIQTGLSAGSKLLEAAGAIASLASLSLDLCKDVPNIKMNTETGAVVTEAKEPVIPSGNPSTAESVTSTIKTDFNPTA